MVGGKGGRRGRVVGGVVVADLHQEHRKAEKVVRNSEAGGTRNFPH